jgi:hypothetical protein
LPGLALLVAACAAAPAATPTAAPTPAAAPTPTAAPTGQPPPETIAFEAGSATITVDGDATDWSAITGATVTLEQIRLANLDPAQAAEIDFNPLPPVEVTFKVAVDEDNIYVLLEVPDDFDYNAEDHNLSPSVAVNFRIDPPAGAHMGAKEPDIDRGLGMVDTWHWELDCGPGEASGGRGIAGGDDPACNFDDEYSTKPGDREDDGGGDVDNPSAENSLNGAWTHSAQGSGAGAAGTWVFEMSRPLETGDPQDGQFSSGSIAYVALAYFDPDEGDEGWTDVGHLQSAYSGWIEVTLP